MRTKRFQNTDRGSIFRDVNALNPKRTPTEEEFVERDEEMDRMESILQYIDHGGARHFLVTGPSGTGKTMAVKIILQDLADYLGDLKTVYMSDPENELRLLRRISSDLELGYGGTDINEYYDRIAETVIDKGIPTIVVIDELEKLLYNQRQGKNHGNSFLKKLLEAEETVVNADTEGTITIIGISNNGVVEDRMSPKVVSRFGREHLKFSKYNAFQLRKILERRKDNAFQNGAVADGVIAKTAAAMANDGGDAREAIEALRVAGELAEQNGDVTVTLDHVDKARDQIEADQIVHTVESLSKQSHFVAYAVIALHKEGGGKLSIGEVYRKYQDLADEQDCKVITQRRIVDLLKELDMVGVFRREVVSKGRHGRKSEICVELGDKTIEALQESLESKYEFGSQTL